MTDIKLFNEYWWMFLLALAYTHCRYRAVLTLNYKYYINIFRYGFLLPLGWLLWSLGDILSNFLDFRSLPCSQRNCMDISVRFSCRCWSCRTAHKRRRCCACCAWVRAPAAVPVGQVSSLVRSLHTHVLCSPTTERGLTLVLTSI